MRMNSLAIPVWLESAGTITTDEEFPIKYSLEEFHELYWRIRYWSAAISITVDWEGSGGTPMAAAFSSPFALSCDNSGQENHRVADIYNRGQALDAVHVLLHYNNDSPHSVSLDILGVGDFTGAGPYVRGKWSGAEGGVSGDIAPRIQLLVFIQVDANITVRLSTIQYPGYSSVGSFILNGRTAALYGEPQAPSIVFDNPVLAAVVDIDPIEYFSYGGVWHATTGAQLLDPLS